MRAKQWQSTIIPGNTYNFMDQPSDALPSDEQLLDLLPFLRSTLKRCLMASAGTINLPSVELRVIFRCVELPDPDMSGDLLQDLDVERCKKGIMALETFSSRIDPRPRLVHVDEFARKTPLPSREDACEEIPSPSTLTKPSHTVPPSKAPSYQDKVVKKFKKFFYLMSYHSH